MPVTRYYGRRRISPFLGVVQVIELEEARAISVDGRRWQLQLLSQEALAEQVWGNIGPREVRRRWFVYGNCESTDAIERIPVNPLVGDPSQHSALPGLLEALAQRPELPFVLQDEYEAWLCDAAGVPLALIDSAMPDEDRSQAVGADWRSLPGMVEGFHSVSSYPAEQGLIPGQALEHLVNRAGMSGRPQWFTRTPDADADAAALPELPWRANWPVAAQQMLFDDYTAFLAPYLLTLPYLTTELRDRLEELAVEQYAVLDAIYELIPAVVDRERMEVARVKARLAQE
jgi:hypothetical protein